MSDENRDLENSEGEADGAFGADVASGFGAPDDGASDSSAGAADRGGATFGGGFGTTRSETIYGEEILPEHLDELPDIENVEDYVGEGHVYDEETAGALVALMFAKTHAEPEQYTPPKPTADPSVSSTESAPPPPVREQIIERAPKKKKGGFGRLVTLLLTVVIVAGAAWLLPEVNWDYFFGGADDAVGDGANSTLSFDYQTSYDGITIDRVYGDRENVVIPSYIDGNRVTAISSYAFAHNSSLRTVILPSSVNRIGECAFLNCSSLEVVEFVGVESIGAQAFYGCTSLRSISLSDSLAVIGDNAFENCYSLGSIVIPGSVWMMGVDAFRGCGNIYIQCMMQDKPVDWAESWCDYYAIVSWEMDVVDVIEWSFVDGGVSIDKYNGLQFNELCIPDTIDGFEVVRIGEDAFYLCDEITKITLPDTVYEIADRAFYNCFSLEIINMPKALKRIGANAFYNARLKEIDLPYGLESIGSEAFYYCDNVSSICIPDTVSEIGESAFYCTQASIYCEADAPLPGWANEWCIYSPVTYGYVSTLRETDLAYYIEGIYATVTGYNGERTKIQIPTYLDGYVVKAIDTHAFLNNTNIKRVILPSTIDTIGYAAFDGCTSLERINIPENVAAIPDRAFFHCSSLEVVELTGGSLGSIGDEAFASCTSLRSISLPDTLYEIKSVAFVNCSSLEEIRIPGNTHVIGSDAFLDCSSLRYVELGYGVERIENGAFASCHSLATVAVPATLLEIGESAFAESLSLLEIRLPASTYVGEGNFVDGFTTVTRTDLDYSTGISFSVDYSESGERYAKVIGSDYYLTELVIPTYYDGAPVREIYYNAFSGRSQLTRIVLPETLKVIGSSAFYGCTGITEIVIPAGVEEIGANAFNSCSSLERARILGAESIREYAFAYCEMLYDVTLPDGLTLLENAFEHSTSISEIFVPASVECIYAYAFGDAQNIKLYTSRGAATELWGYSYGSFPSNVTVYWNYQVPRITDLGFRLTEDGMIITALAAPGVVNIPLHIAGVRVIGLGSNMLDNNTEITEVRVPTTIELIETGAFYSAYSLESVYIPASVRVIKQNAFYTGNGYTIYCEVAEQPDGWEEYWNNTGCDVLWGRPYQRPEELYTYAVKEGIDGNRYVTITGYSGYEEIVTVPEYIGGYAVKDIDSYAFSENSTIRVLRIPDGIECIGYRAFYGCASLEQLYLSTTPLRIDGYAFADCSSLNYIYVVDGLEYIGESAFRGTAITGIYLPDSVKTIEREAFASCTSLESVSIPIETTYIGEYAFNSPSNVIIYYEGSEIPEEWDKQWNSGVYQVYYNWR